MIGEKYSNRGPVTKVLLILLYNRLTSYLVPYLTIGLDLIYSQVLSCTTLQHKEQTCIVKVRLVFIKCHSLASKTSIRRSVNGEDGGGRVLVLGKKWKNT